VVLDWDTEEEQDKINYGLDGSSEEELVTFEELYIRQYKPSLKKPSSNNMNDFISENYKSFNEVEKMVALGLINIYHADHDIIETKIPPLIEPIVGRSIFDDLLYQNILTSGYFPKNVDVFINKMTHGYSFKYNDSVWNALMQTITIKDTNNITGIKDSLSILRILYDKFEGDKSNFVVFLGFSLAGYQNTALINLFIRIIECFLRNKIAEDDFEKTYKSLLGSIFLNDTETEEEIIPFVYFKYFLGKIGVKNYFGDDDIDVTISKNNFPLQGKSTDAYKIIFEEFPNRNTKNIIGNNKFLFIRHSLPFIINNN
jgi:hypothetical protein